MGTGMVAAKLWKRLLAMVYDTLIVAGLLMIAGFAVLPFTGGRAVPAGAWWFQTWLLAVTWAYFALSWWRGGHTLGARAWKLQVRDEAGRLPDLGRASLRALLALIGIGFFGIGLLWALIDNEKRSAYDRLSGTWLLEPVKE